MSEKPKEPANPVVCWGCECNVPIVDGMHAEDTDDPIIKYTYPCSAEPALNQHPTFATLVEAAGDPGVSMLAARAT